VNTPARNRRLRVQLGFGTLARLVTNTAHRMPFPFLPEFSRGLGAPVRSLVLLLSLRSALSMAAPLFGSVSDRFGRRRVMYMALALFAGGLGLVAAFPGLPAFVAAVLLAAIAKMLFDPAFYAFMSDRTPYAQRGLVMGVVELSWSGAFLIGMPLVGWTMARKSAAAWSAPFFTLALLGLLAGVGLWLVMPHDAPHRGQPARALPGRWQLVLKNPRALAGLAVGMLISMASENLSIVLGIWLEGAFSLSLAALGFSTAVIGLAELLGEGAVIGFVDRLGKRRAIAGGLVLSTAAYLALPFMAGTLAGGLAGLFLTFVTFEFTLVATLPLISELVPQARASMISANTGAHAFGRTFGALLGNALFQVGFFWNGGSAALLNLLALAVLLLWLPEADPAHAA